MSKAKKNSIDVQGSAIAVVSNDTGDIISLTDMAKKVDRGHGSHRIPIQGRSLRWRHLRP